MSTELVLVLSTSPNIENASKIARNLVQKKLAACVHVSAPGTSFYSWENKLCEDQEYQIWAKTKKSLLEPLEAEILAHHPFQTPQILSMPIESGHPAYLSWVKENTQDLKKK